LHAPSVVPNVATRGITARSHRTPRPSTLKDRRIGDPHARNAALARSCHKQTPRRE
jgi:hypothetical protein